MFERHSDFTKNEIRIWRTVQAIPYGKVASYGQIADLAGLPKRARLVGKLLGTVPKEGFQGKAVPWYRVINSQGRISLPRGSDGFERQKGLLQEEQVVVNGDRIKLRYFQWQPDLQSLLYELDY